MTQQSAERRHEDGPRGEARTGASFLRRAVRFVWQLLAEEQTLSPEVRRQYRTERAARLNRRLALFCPLLAVLHLAHLIIFAPRCAAPGVAGEWAQDIFGSHLTMSVVSAVLSVVSILLLRREPEQSTNARATLVVLSAWAYLIHAAELAGFDQLVTPNVTPFVAGAIAVGLTLPLPVLPSLVGHALALALYVRMMELYQPDDAVRTSNEVNGLTITVFAFGLSRVLESGRGREFANRIIIDRQQAALEAANEELQRLATQDPLTALPNRRFFFSRAEEVRLQAARSGRPASLIVFDADHFKAVNDTRGHAAGDAVLQAVADAMRQVLRATDVAGRTGGEEFAVLLPDTPYEAALEVAERLRAKIEALRLLPEGDLRVTVSLGVVPVAPASDAAITEAMARADGALYEAKHQGRNRVVGRAA